MAALTTPPRPSFFPRAVARETGPWATGVLPKPLMPIRFAIEELSLEFLIGAHLEVNEERFNCDGIRRLYEHAEYRWCDVLPFDERPDPAMMDSARDEASAATGGQHGGFEAARGPCR